MKYKIEVKESASQDAVKAFIYYENKHKGLGNRFLNCWENHLESLQNEPLIYQKIYKNFRQVLIKPFPYHIIYEIENKSIIVYRVSYSGRHPSRRYTKK